MTVLSRFFGKGPATECSGDAVISDGNIVIDCSGCRGPSDVSDPFCFRGVSGKLPPGFSGDIILSGAVEKGYSGAVVEALSAYSEVMELASAMRDSIRSSGRGDGDRKEVLKLLKLLEKDPSLFLERAGKVRKSMGRDGDLSAGMDELMERTSLMIRRLRRALRSQGSV